MGDVSEEYRKLPSVDRLLQADRLNKLVGGNARAIVLAAARLAVDGARAWIAAGGSAPDFDDLVSEVVATVQRLERPRLRRVTNATGVIIHTNLGRAPLSQEAVRAMAEACSGYSNLELDLETGERGSRQAHVEGLLCQVTGAEAGLVVNNNAGAVLLALAAMAQGSEVIVSRGQAVEIGGGFRIPDVMRQSGATLVEVGTTNRTYLSDYETAIGPGTAILLHVHPSNFRLSGFTHSVDIAELGQLAQRSVVPLVDDIGSGALLDTSAFGLAHEPQVQESVAAGASLVCFSGDKLLGGPQAGLIVGRRDAVGKLRKHPLARALRIDKADMAGLEATLRHYALGEAESRIPVWRMIALGKAEIEARAKNWAETVERWGIVAAVVETESTIGGGSLPGETLPTWALALGSQTDRDAGTLPSVDEMAALLRAGNPPIVARIERERLLLDPRTVLPEEDEELLAGLRAALGAARA